MPSSFNCPNCSAPLDYAGDAVAIRCPYCNSSVILPEAVRSLNADAPVSPTLNFGPLLWQASALAETYFEFAPIHPKTVSRSKTFLRRHSSDREMLAARRARN